MLPEFTDHKYLPHDVAILLGPWKKIMKKNSAQRYFKKIANQCEDYSDILELYPYGRCEYLEDFYDLHRIICTGNETIINELFALQAWYGSRSHIVTSLLILFHPNKKFLYILEQLKKVAREENQWLINLAFNHINDSVCIEDKTTMRHVSQIIKTSESLTSMPYFIRANLLPSQSKRIKQEHEILKTIYKNEGVTKATEYWESTLQAYLQRDLMSLQKIDLSDR